MMSNIAISMANFSLSSPPTAAADDVALISRSTLLLTLQSTVQPITSVLAVCCKQELWYSSNDVDMMRVEIRRDASALARTLLSPSAKDVEEGIDISQAVGLDRHVNPIMRRKIQKTTILQKRTVVSLQEEVQDVDELRRISQRFSRASSTRAHALAVYWALGGNGSEREHC